MKFSELWLREWVNPDCDSFSLGEQLTMAGLEVDSIKPVAAISDLVVVGKVLTCEQHPNADKLSCCTVDVGDDVLNIVCGAKNVAAGQKVPVAKVGATVGEIKLKKVKLRGEPSHGMICSATELGLDGYDSSGIMVLPDDAEVGERFIDYFDLDDYVFDVDLTPNRSDCLSMYGLAREVAVLNQLYITPISVEAYPATIAASYPVAVVEPESCPRYVGRVIKGIDNTVELPLAVIEKLRRSGVRSVSPVVDITNFVMLELGQPMHAFDVDKLNEAITVRAAEAGEHIVLLDGSKKTLASGDLVIADAEGPIALAGVMGGEHSGCDEDTDEIFLESAFFDPAAISGTARRYGLHTDSSHRFERGVDFHMQQKAIERASHLICEFLGGEAGAIIEEVSESHLPSLSVIELRREQLNKVLGIKIANNIVENILESLGITIAATDYGWKLTPPSMRFDLRIEADLIEEIARIYGYDNIPARIPRLALSLDPISERQKPALKLKQILQQQGFQEVVTYSFVNNKFNAAFSDAEAISLANPISKDMAEMRTTQWASLLPVALENLKRQKQIKIFETGLVFTGATETDQVQMLSGLVTGPVQDRHWDSQQQRNIDFYDLKAELMNLFADVDPAALSIIAKAHKALHPGQSAVVTIDGTELGYFGRLHPALEQQWQVRAPMYLFEFNMAPLKRGRLAQFSPISKFPSMRRDLALVLDQKITAAELLTNVRANAGDLLQDCFIFDLYQGAGIAEGKKSLALALIFQHPSRTLIDDEVNQVVATLLQQLEQDLSASLRE